MLPGSHASRPKSAEGTRNEEMHRLFSEFSKSDLSARAFCEAHGVQEARFYRWKKKLGIGPRTNSKALTQKPGEKFIRVEMAESGSKCSDMVRTGFELRFPAGLMARIPERFDDIWLERLLRVSWR